MKFGFQIKIQSSLSNDEMKIAEDFANSFIAKTLNDPKKRYNGDNTKGGWESFFKRGSYGMTLSSGLVFRRISKNKRIFGIVRANELIGADNNEISEKCPCPKCKGGLDAKWRSGIIPEMLVYAGIGEISG